MNFMTTVNGEMGKNLLQQAQAKRNEDLGKLCISEVQGIMLRLEMTERNIELGKLNVDIYRRQMQAIEDGAIKVLRNSNGQIGIAFDDAELNDPVTGCMTHGRV